MGNIVLAVVVVCGSSGRRFDGGHFLTTVPLGEVTSVYACVCVDSTTGDTLFTADCRNRNERKINEKEKSVSSAVLRRLRHNYCRHTDSGLV